ncbi:hypothetical protein HG531_007668 [Fusarium graminearum]|nr:hypothetical protein HG531_007668 [Fusarium graminearum]
MAPAIRATTGTATPTPILIAELPSSSFLADAGDPSLFTQYVEKQYLKQQQRHRHHEQQELTLRSDSTILCRLRNDSHASRSSIAARVGRTTGPRITSTITTLCSSRIRGLLCRFCWVIPLSGTWLREARTHAVRSIVRLHGSQVSGAITGRTQRCDTLGHEVIGLGRRSCCRSAITVVVIRIVAAHGSAHVAEDGVVETFADTRVANVVEVGFDGDTFEVGG